MASAYNDESLALAQLTVGRDYYQQAIRLLQPAMQAQTGPSRMLASGTVREGTQAGQKREHTQHNTDKQQARTTHKQTKSNNKQETTAGFLVQALSVRLRREAVRVLDHSGVCLLWWRA